MAGYIVTREQIITTICVNWRKLDVIQDEEIELAATHLMNVSTIDLVYILLETSQLLPENAETATRESEIEQLDRLWNTEINE